MMVAVAFEVALLCQYLINKLEEFESNAAVVLSVSLQPQPFAPVQVEGKAKRYLIVAYFTPKRRKTMFALLLDDSADYFVRPAAGNN